MGNMKDTIVVIAVVAAIIGLVAIMFVDPFESPDDEGPEELTSQNADASCLYDYYIRNYIVNTNQAFTFADKGHVFVEVWYMIGNVNREAGIPNTPESFQLYVDGAVYSMDGATYKDYYNNRADRVIPGGTMMSAVVFQIPDYLEPEDVRLMWTDPEIRLFIQYSPSEQS